MPFASSEGPKLAPEELMKIWVSEWAKDGVAIDLKNCCQRTLLRPSYRGDG